MEQLLTTKLYIPQPHPNLITRPSLIEQLNASLLRQSGSFARKHTLISAPAGYGKTTLLIDWASQNDMSVAWVSLDEDDNDPSRFLAYFITALRSIHEELGKTALGMLRSPQPPPMRTVLTTLINEINTISENFVLILDDYHFINDQTIQDTLNYLLRNLPPQMHLIIATRKDPLLSLARLRAQGQMTEIRAGNLRFTRDEVTAYFNQVVGEKLPSEEIVALEIRTEGWITGLQLAALSMQGLKRREDITSFIKSFTGDDRYIVDYLVDEVLAKRPEGSRDFLLQTSILDRLTGSLCDAVTGQEGGQDILERLEQANLFITPLDNRRQWYRYHHMFADLLRQKLQQHHPDDIPELHRRASKWYSSSGLREEAIEHALVAQDFDRAANLIEEIAADVLKRGQQVKLSGWLNALPDEIILSRPQLCVLHAWALLISNQSDAAEMRLRDAEHMLEVLPEEQKPELFNDDKNKPELTGKIAIIRAYISIYQGDLMQTIKLASLSRKLIRKSDLLWRSLASNLLGFAHAKGDGDLDGARRAYLEADNLNETLGNIYLKLGSSAHLGEIEYMQGFPNRAVQKYRELLRLAHEHGMVQTDMVGWISTLIGITLCELNALDEGIKHLENDIKLLEQGYDIGALGTGYINLINAQFYRGDYDLAQEAIQRFDKVTFGVDIPPWVSHPISAWQARIWLATGNLDAASQWMIDRGVCTDNDFTLRREEEHIVLARILIAQNRLREADKLLTQLIEKAKSGTRITRVIEMRLVRALALSIQGDNAAALDELTLALFHAKPGGYVHIFVVEGSPMAQLLYKAYVQGVEKDYIRELLAAYPDIVPARTGSTQVHRLQSLMVEPLSERECGVLQLIAEGLTNQEIASKLFLTLNTVKAHNRNIYSKLGVNNRTQAIAKARVFGIL